MRLDKYVTDLHPQLSRHQVKKLITKGQVLVNDHSADPDYQVLETDKIKVLKIPKLVDKLIPQDIPLSVIYEDHDFLVVDKPAGTVVHPGAGNPQGTLANALAAHLKDTRLLERVGIVHRLDKDTSGLMVVAKNESTQKELQRLFKLRRITKEYLALVKGRPLEIAGELNYPVGRDPKNRLKFTVTPDGREALSRFFTERKLPHHTLLRLIPVTGRTHQLRVHLSHLGHPISGDTIYGGEKGERLFLHAANLRFKLNGKEWAFESNLPEDLKTILTKLG